MTPTLTPTTPTTSTPLLTATEFTERYGGRHAELIEGVVKEYPMPFPRHGKICGTITGLLWQQAGDLGHIMTNDSWIQTGRNPDTVRGADVCFFSYERLPKGPIPEGLLPVAPDLVIEVRSPSDLWTEILGKMLEYLEAGVRVVVILDPKTQSATVYRADELQQIFHSGDSLVIPDVLPGFSVPVKRLFE